MASTKKINQAKNDINMAIYQAHKRYKLNNAEIIGVLQGICITLVVIMVEKRKEMNGGKV